MTERETKREGLIETNRERAKENGREAKRKRYLLRLIKVHKTRDSVIAWNILL